jgi:hypothetical protein
MGQAARGSSTVAATTTIAAAAAAAACAGLARARLGSTPAKAHRFRPGNAGRPGPPGPSAARCGTVTGSSGRGQRIDDGGQRPPYRSGIRAHRGRRPAAAVSVGDKTVWATAATAAAPKAIHRDAYRSASRYQPVGNPSRPFSRLQRTST